MAENIVIAFSGKAGSGKDTSADIARSILEEGGYKVVNISFAQALKSLAQKYFPFCDVVKKDPVSRQTLQGLGTLMRDEVDTDYWVNLSLKKIDSILASNKDSPVAVLITDLRFKNELYKLKDYTFNEPADVYLVRLEGRTLLEGGAAQHSSETDLDNLTWEFTGVYKNTGTLSDLENYVRRFIDEHNLV